MNNEIRILPDKWRIVKLHEIAERLPTGNQYDRLSTKPQGRVPVIDQSEEGYAGYHDDEPGIMATASTPIITFANHTCAVRLHKSPFSVIQNVFPLLAREGTDALFLFWLLRGRVKMSFYGGHWPKLVALDFPLPPLDEQRRLAALLTDQLAAVDRARAAVEEQLAAANALPAAYLRSVFESEEAKEWERTKLVNHSIKIGSGITPRGGQAVYLNKGIPLIRSQNIHMNRFVYDGLAFISDEQDIEMEMSRVQPDDVLLNITGASIGRVCVVPTELCPANVNQHVSIIRADSTFEPHFLSLYISTPSFQKSIMDSQSGATRQALTKALIENFQIPIPELSVQQRVIVQVQEQMSAVDRTRQVLEQQLATINQLPAALLRRAFSGEL